MHLFPQLIPDTGYLRGRRVIAQVDINDRLSGAGLALNRIQRRDLLHLLFEHVCEQLYGGVYISAGPPGRDHRSFDGERRVFIT